MEKQVSTEHLKQLVHEFTEAATKHGKYTEAGKWRKANREVERINHLFDELLLAGNDGLSVLLTLKDSHNDYVVLTAVAYLLTYYPDQCMSVLSRLSMESNLVGFEAAQAIQRWEEGNWDLNEQTDRQTQNTEMPVDQNSGNLPLSDLDTLLRNMPTRVNWEDIPEFDLLDERVGVANGLVPFTVGVNEGYLSWIPNNVPPAMVETLTWIWVIRSDLSREIADRTTDEALREEILGYLEVKAKENRRSTE